MTALVLAACSSDAFEPADELQEAETAVDQFIAAWNTRDSDAVVAALADEFYFKGLGPYEPERTDADSMKSYVDALAPLDASIERASSVTRDEAGVMTVDVILSSDELQPRLTQMEQIEVTDGKLSRLATVSWEKVG